MGESDRKDEIEISSKEIKNSILPLPFSIAYTCLIIDAGWKDFLHAVGNCTSPFSDSSKEIDALATIWRQSPQNMQHSILPCLSVRTAFDLYLQVMSFPEGSEVIMSAINIPSMVQIVKYHKLKPVPLDINLDTTAPKLEILPHLITEKTKLIVLAHIYGKWFDTGPFLDIAATYGLPVIEDCAEGFHGFEHIGNPRSDLCLFSFGAIKYNTSLGGAIATIRERSLYEKMSSVHNCYPVQTRTDYIKKLMKYFVLYLILNKTWGNLYVRILLQAPFNVSHQEIQAIVISFLRGFPAEMMIKIRQRPCRGLLLTMLKKHQNYDQTNIVLTNAKAEYVLNRLPECMTKIARKAMINNTWLFPVFVENPDEFLPLLNKRGVDAYIGATQLSVVEPEESCLSPKLLQNDSIRYPHEAKYLIDHVIYLPVNRLVPYHTLDHMCTVITETLYKCQPHVVSDEKNIQPKIKSKL